MLRGSLLGLFVAIVMSATPVVCAAEAVPVLPPCTSAVVQTVDAVDSSKAKAGDFFRIKSIDAVTFNDKIVVPSGTPGYGIVTLAVAAGKGHGGALGLEPLYFLFPDGRKLHIVRDRRPNALQGQGASGQLPGYLGAVPIPGVGLILAGVNSFKKGKDVTIPVGTLASVWASDSPATAKCNAQ